MADPTFNYDNDTEVEIDYDVLESDSDDLEPESVEVKDEKNNDSKTTTKLAFEVIAGKHGKDYGDACEKLDSEGFDGVAILQKIDDILMGRWD